MTLTTTTTKNKVLFIMGTTGTGKTKLSLSLGSSFPSEIINSDKIQVYKGLDVVSNKVSETEQRRIPHHLLGIIDDPDMDFSISDFCSKVLSALDQITERGNLPIIVGGSNTYLEALVEDPANDFRSKYDCCFIWLDVSLPVLFDYLGKRVDVMIEEGFVDEIREAFVSDADYSRGLRRAIGVPEFDQFMRAKKEGQDEAHLEELLEDATARTKENTNKLAEVQLGKIHRLKNERGWELKRINATPVFEAIAKGDKYESVWEEIVFKPSLKIVMSSLG
ncbi:hypothetical protein L6164_028695 [Bauhinia variegata]|uniref:Uncharacterized protein n=1 Tax=Bauhinia variegata TaxID=167791 RepID=A0ACB9L7E3_BAUVA|nr:hypothetical protein L6164_028695 [Bauhinia variegata]